MFRIASYALLGFALALPVAASAADDSASQPIEVAAVANGDASTDTPAAQPSREAKRSESARRSDGEVRGSRQGDPGVRFHNPYAFPLQTLPISLPSFAGMGL